MMPRLVVRVDGSREIGFGHAVRCLALIQAWIDHGGTASVASAFLPDPVRRSMLDEGVEIIDLPSVDAITNPLLRSFEQADWVIFDGYRFPSDIREIARQHCQSIGLIDDFAISSRPVDVDLLIDQNLGVDPECYLHDGISRSLLGTRYVLLRRFFRETSTPRRQARTGRLKILFLTGGSRHPVVVEAFLDAARELSNQGHEVVTIGGDFDTSRFDFDALPRVMTEADLAVSTAGSTCWELVWSGTPVVAIPTADNQGPIAERLTLIGAAESLDPRAQEFRNHLGRTISGLIAIPERRQEMAEIGQKLVDGLGAERVVVALLEAS